MLFAFFVFLSAFLIESIGSYISIVGLSALFSTNPVIIALALSWDIAKVITVSFLYKQWGNISKSMKYYMTVAACILMVITSSGAAGYLSAEFQKAIIPTKGSEILVKSMSDEKTRLEARKIEIDKQISQLPPENVKGRQKLQKQFAPELDHINGRIIEIDQALPKLQMQQVDVNAHAGPILYIAQAFDTTVESAVKYVILLIIFVFDPLAVALIIAGNFLLDQKRKEEKDQISVKLDEITNEVKHIEHEIEELVTHESKIEEPSSTIVEMQKEETPREIEHLTSLTSMSNDKSVDNSSNIENTEISEEPIQDELSEEIESNLSGLVVDDVPIQSEASTKKKRGRKKKEESEPKPSITTDEQLNSVSFEQEETIHDSDLNKVNHLSADVEFKSNDPQVSQVSGWPSKKVLNIYQNNV